MDNGGNGSFEGYPGQVFWTPKTPASTNFLDPNMNCENGSESMLNKPIIGTSFGCWEANTGLEDRVPDINVGLYERLLVDNVWSGMPCGDLLALGDAAVTKVSSGGVSSSPTTNGSETVVNVQLSDHSISGGFMPDSEQGTLPYKSQVLTCQMLQLLVVPRKSMLSLMLFVRTAIET